MRGSALPKPLHHGRKEHVVYKKGMITFCSAEFVLFYNEQEYQATPTGNDPAVSASTVLCVGQLHHGAKAASIYMKHACSELFS